MDTFLLGLGESNTSKPNNNGIVSSRKIAFHNYHEYDLADAADKIGNQGYGFYPEYLVGGQKQENFVSMQLFPVDFDGKDDKKISFEEIKKRADYYNLKIAFAYRTLSCPDGPEFYKFRIVFVMDQVITDKTVATLIYKIFVKIFPECDSACAEISRFFLGGKELFYEDLSARVYLMQTINSLYQYLNKNRNRNRDLIQFVNKNSIDIAVINGLLAIGPIETLSTFDAKGVFSNSPTLVGITCFASFFYIKKSKVSNKDFLHQDNTCRHKPKQRYDIKEVSSSCQLLKDFINNIELDHMERFLLVTNLNAVSNGLNWFYEYMESCGVYSDETIDRWKRDQVTYRSYKPASCNENCRYFSTCSKHGAFKNIISKFQSDRCVTINRQISYGTLAEAEIELAQNLETAFLSDDKSIHLIRAQTGLGKSRNIVQLIKKYPDKKYLIAEPTNILKQEIADNIRRNGIDVKCTASVREARYLPIDIANAYMDLHQQGEHKKARDVIKDHLKKLKADNPEPTGYILNAIDECDRILKGARACMDCNVVVTTHALLLNLKSNILQEFDAVIVDEDFLYQQILNNVKTVSRAIKTDFQRALSTDESIKKQISADMFSVQNETIEYIA